MCASCLSNMLHDLYELYELQYTACADIIVCLKVSKCIMKLMISQALNVLIEFHTFPVFGLHIKCVSPFRDPLQTSQVNYVRIPNQTS